MAQIKYTHNWSLFLVIIGVILFMFFYGFIISLSHSLFDYKSDWLDAIPFLIAAVIFFYFYFKYASTLSTFLYVRFSLRTKISFLEAKIIAILFLPDAYGKWYPMNGIKKLPKEERRSALLAAAFIMEKKREKLNIPY